MKQPKEKVGRWFLVFAGICLITLPLIVYAAFSYEPKEIKATAIVEAPGRNFDHNGNAIFDNLDRISKDYLQGASTERTLEEYYERRQYPGSPPVIPHKVEAVETAKTACLTCHAKGGWADEFKRHTPVTPHPEQTACRQCHVPMTENLLFIENLWLSVSPPLLGRSHLPGSPRPIPHDLQTRGNCIACHVGPGAVTAIRVSHADRGNCRQCHVPDIYPGLFER
jgi:nitrate reductase (cytochrome), electron transfer subunit